MLRLVRRACGPLAWAMTLSLAGAMPVLAQPDHRARERAILAELIEIDTGPTGKATTEAAEAMARHLVAAGLPADDVRVISVVPGIGNLVARYRGTGAGGRPILLMAHLDVVEALREDWSFAPFEFRERDGYYYGRGSSDNKAGIATLISTIIRYREEGFVPSRDLIIVLTGDEETSGDSIRLLLEQHRDLVDAEFALNTDAGGGELRDGRPIAFSVQTAEKVYLSFALEVRDDGGHSSVPGPSNAIYRLAAGLTRLAGFAFPVRLNETTRTFFDRAAEHQPADLARDMRALAREDDAAAASRLAAASPFYNATMRTTCVATGLSGGHAENALPQLARAVINCRMLPDDPAGEVEAALVRVLADPAITLSRIAPPVPSPASPLRADVVGPIEALVAEMWPGAVVVPEMSTGATDGAFTRNAGIPTYGVSAVFGALDDIRAHGRDERIGVEPYHRAAEFWYRLLKRLAS
ncbi:MAG: M20/M25/M40 family metallo-hydrolase [Vicinamibacterales bacterium]|nr:M20/M25/M40 family metallo-hydrolase [Vicinamibacterales bacterium]